MSSKFRSTICVCWKKGNATKDLESFHNPCDAVPLLTATCQANVYFKSTSFRFFTFRIHQNHPGSASVLPFLFVELGIKPKDSCMLGKCSVTALHPQPTPGHFIKNTILRPHSEILTQLSVRTPDILLLFLCF